MLIFFRRRKSCVFAIFCFVLTIATTRSGAILLVDNVAATLRLKPQLNTIFQLFSYDRADFVLQTVLLPLR